MNLRSCKQKNSRERGVPEGAPFLFARLAKGIKGM